MKYYTKEWYELLQQQHYTSGLKKVPDKMYSNQEIQAFYDADLDEEVNNDIKIYNTPPDYSWAEHLLDPTNFQPNYFLFENEETGELFHPETSEIARQYIEQEHNEREEVFAKRPPFDPTETIECFRQCYKNMVRYGDLGYPQWVRDSVDKRLLALHRVPESVYNRLRKEELANQRIFKKIMKEAEEILGRQNIPKNIKSQFCFHDADLLALKKVGSNVELYLRKDGMWFEGTTPYTKVIFKNVSRMEREKGFALRPKTNEQGELCSNCQYLYNELYRNLDGYEVHILLWTSKALRYLTICCEDICFVDNIEL